MKAIESVAGLVEGITIDAEINSAELAFLHDWLEDHQDVAHRHPYNEIHPRFRLALEDGVLTEDEKLDILWLCRKILSDQAPGDSIDADMRQLHGILGGIACDTQIHVRELSGLREWLSDHEHLKTRWPYDEVDSHITRVLSDGKIDDREQKELMAFFAEFVHRADDRTIIAPPIQVGGLITGVCAVAPEIVFQRSTFCLTGASRKYTRSQFVEIISALGGEFSNTVTKRVNYLVVGADGNPCWSYACYGRKVEAAIRLRKAGSSLLIVHENDFHDVVADN